MEKKVNAVGQEFRELEKHENLFTKEVQANAAKISKSLNGVDTDVVKVEKQFKSLIRQIDAAAREVDAAGEDGTQFRVEMIRNLNKVQAEFDQTKQSAKETALQVEKIGSAAMRSQARMQSLWQRTNQLSGSMSRLGTSAAFALGSIVYGVQRAIGVYADWGLQIQKVNLLTGLSVERSSQMVAQWKMMGILPKAGATALRYLAKNLETAKSDLDKYEKRAGFSQRSFDLGTLRQKLASEASAKTSALSLQASNTAAAAAAQKASISYANAKTQLEKATHASKIAITETQRMAAEASMKSAKGAMEALGVSAMQRSEAAALASARAAIASGKTTTKEALRKMQEKLMADRLEFALPSTVKSFGSLGITPEQLKNLSTQDIIERTLAALAKLPSTERTKYMVKLLGRQGSEIVRWLKLSAKEKEKLAVTVREAGLEWAEDDLAEWDKYYKGKKIMELQWIALQITLSKSIMPWVLKLIHYSVDLTKRLTPYADNIRKIVAALAVFVVATKGASMAVQFFTFAAGGLARGFLMTGAGMFLLLYIRSEKFRNSINKLAKGLYNAFSKLPGWLKPVLKYSAIFAVVFGPAIISALKFWGVLKSIYLTMMAIRTATIVGGAAQGVSLALSAAGGTAAAAAGSTAVAGATGTGIAGAAAGLLASAAPVIIPVAAILALTVAGYVIAGRGGRGQLPNAPEPTSDEIQAIGEATNDSANKLITKDLSKTFGGTYIVKAGKIVWSPNIIMPDPTQAIKQGFRRYMKIQNAVAKFTQMQAGAKTMIGPVQDQLKLLNAGIAQAKHNIQDLGRQNIYDYFGEGISYEEILNVASGAWAPTAALPKKLAEDLVPKLNQQVVAAIRKEQQHIATAGRQISKLEGEKRMWQNILGMDINTFIKDGKLQVRRLLDGMRDSFIGWNPSTGAAPSEPLTPLDFLGKLNGGSLMPGQTTPEQPAPATGGRKSPVGTSRGRGSGEARAGGILFGRIIESAGTSGDSVGNTFLDSIFNIWSDKEKVKKPVDIFVTLLNNILGIHSPSTVGIGIGENFGQGFLIGVRNKLTPGRDNPVLGAIGSLLRGLRLSANGGLGVGAALGTGGTIIAAGGRGGRILDYAQQWLGLPYVWGGNGPTQDDPTAGFDCSGLVKRTYAHFGIGLPRTAAGMQSAPIGVSVPSNKLKPADLLFYGSPAYHVALAGGHGMMLESSGGGVQTGPLRTPTGGAKRLIRAAMGARIDKPTLTIAGEKNREWIFNDDQLGAIVSGGKKIEVNINHPHFLGKPTRSELNVLAEEISRAIGENMVIYGRSA
jgi:hypothetical protein